MRTLKTIYRLLFLFLFLGTLSACVVQEEEQQAINDGIADPDINDRPQIVHPSDKPYCYSETYFQPDADITKKIDVLFVIDTSGSLGEEREAIGDGVDAFVGAMPSDVDLQFGVMLAHAGRHSGVLYRYDNQLPYVIPSKDYSVDRLREILRTRMRRVATETETDGGEVGLYSLSQALKSENLALSRSQGFFRDDAALAVVFVADENDICARYPEGVTPVRDPNGYEVRAFDKYCGDVTSESVLSELKEFQGGRPLLLGGILYNQNSIFEHRAENEIGYGYLEMIEMANGISIDLSGNRFHEGLDQIGTLATKKIQLVTEYPLQQDEFNTSSLVVEVDGSAADYEYNSETNEIHLTEYAGHENSEVYISYCVDVPGEEPEPVVILNFRVVSLTETSIQIMWETNEPASSQLEAVDLASLEVLSSDLNLDPKTEHNVTLSDLRPNTVYSVRALSGTEAGITASQPVVFRTQRGF